MTQQEYNSKVVPHARRVFMDLQNFLGRVVVSAETLDYTGDFDELMEYAVIHFMRTAAERMDGQRLAVVNARILVERCGL